MARTDPAFAAELAEIESAIERASYAAEVADSPHRRKVLADTLYALAGRLGALTEQLYRETNR